MDRSYIATNDASRARLETFIAGCDEAMLSRPTGDGWTVSSLLAHLAFFDRRTCRIIDRWKATGVFDESPYDVHILNDAMKPAWLALAPRAAADEALAAAVEADCAVAELSDEMIAAAAESGTFSVNRSTHRNHELDLIANRLG